MVSFVNSNAIEYWKMCLLLHMLWALNKDIFIFSWVMEHLKEDFIHRMVKFFRHLSSRLKNSTKYLSLQSVDNCNYWVTLIQLLIDCSSFPLKITGIEIITQQDYYLIKVGKSYLVGIVSTFHHCRQINTRHKETLPWESRPRLLIMVPDSKVHGVNMGPIWGRLDPCGPHVGPMNFAIWGITKWLIELKYLIDPYFHLELTSFNIAINLIIPLCHISCGINLDVLYDTNRNHSLQELAWIQNSFQLW